MLRARAYQALSSHYGAYNFDQHPLSLTRKDIRARYRGIPGILK
jgi:hypothetical protein